MRKRLDLSQQELAIKIGVSRSYLGDIERDRCAPSAAFLTALTSNTDGSADWVMTGEGSMLRGDARPAGGRGGCEDASPVLDDQRVKVLLDLLQRADPKTRDAILSDAITRAEMAEQVDELRRAVLDMGAKRRA